jgi:hypothetical protein
MFTKQTTILLLLVALAVSAPAAVAQAIDVGDPIPCNMTKSGSLTQHGVVYQSGFCLAAPELFQMSRPPKIPVLIFQPDGNLVLYLIDDKGVITDVRWASNTSNKGGKFLAFQSDGNLVIYTTENNGVLSGPIFATQTGRPNAHPDDHVSVQNDGNVVIYRDTCEAIFATNTSGVPNFTGPGDELGCGT